VTSNPFIRFNDAAETAGYPALFVVSMIALALVVVPVALLALTRATWMLAVALGSIVLALVLLAGALAAVFAEGERDGPGADEGHQPHGY
jgi:hypothetical protein